MRIGLGRLSILNKNLKAVVASTIGVVFLVENADKLSTNISDIKSAIYSNGNHLMHDRVPLGNGLSRTHWFIRIKETSEPMSIWIDVTDDLLKDVTSTIEMGTI